MEFVVDYLPQQLEALCAEATQLFNEKPKRGIQFLVSSYVIEDSPEDVAKFLFSQTKLSKRWIGEYIGGGDIFNQTVSETLFDMFPFKGLSLDEAIRHFAKRLRLPGEAQKIDRIVEKFASSYHKQNPENKLSVDTYYVLAFSIIMLNTDLHNPAIAKNKKMTLGQFILNNQRIDPNITVTFCTDIYHKIKREPITMNEEDMFESAQTSFIGPTKAGWLYKKSRKGILSRSQKRWFVLKDSCLYYFKTPNEKIPRCILPMDGIVVIRKSMTEMVLMGRTNDKKIKTGKYISTSIRNDGRGSIQHGSRDELILRAKTENDCEEWFVHLRGESEPIHEILRRNNSIDHSQSQMISPQISSSVSSDSSSTSRIGSDPAVSSNGLLRYSPRLGTSLNTKLSSNQNSQTSFSTSTSITSSIQRNSVDTSNVLQSHSDYNLLTQQPLKTIERGKKMNSVTNLDLSIATNIENAHSTIISPISRAQNSHTRNRSPSPQRLRSTSSNYRGMLGIDSTNLHNNDMDLSFVTPRGVVIPFNKSPITSRAGSPTNQHNNKVCFQTPSNIDNMYTGNDEGNMTGRRRRNSRALSSKSEGVVSDLDQVNVTTITTSNTIRVSSLNRSVPNNCEDEVSDVLVNISSLRTRTTSISQSEKRLPFLEKKNSLTRMSSHIEQSISCNNNSFMASSQLNNDSKLHNKSSFLNHFSTSTVQDNKTTTASVSEEKEVEEFVDDIKWEPVEDISDADDDDDDENDNEKHNRSNSERNRDQSPHSILRRSKNIASTVLSSFTHSSNSSKALEQHNSSKGSSHSTSLKNTNQSTMLYVEARASVLMKRFSVNHPKEIASSSERPRSPLQNSVINPLKEGWLYIRDCSIDFRYSNLNEWILRYCILCDSNGLGDTEHSGPILFYYPSSERVVKMKMEGAQTQMRYCFLQSLATVCINKVRPLTSFASNQNKDSCESKDDKRYLNSNSVKELDELLDQNDVSIILDESIEIQNQSRHMMNDNNIKEMNILLDQSISDTSFAISDEPSQDIRNRLDIDDIIGVSPNTLNTLNESQDEKKLSGTLKSSNTAGMKVKLQSQTEQLELIGPDIEEQVWKKLEVKSIRNLNTVAQPGTSNNVFSKWKKFESHNLIERQSFPLRHKLQTAVNLPNSPISSGRVSTTHVPSSGSHFNIESPDEFLQTPFVTSQIRLKSGILNGTKSSTYPTGNRSYDIFLSHPNTNTLIEWFDIIKYHTVDINNT